MVIGLKTLVRNMVEPVQLLYVLMFSVSLIHMDKIYVDKVCQVYLLFIISRSFQLPTHLPILHLLYFNVHNKHPFTGQPQIMDRETQPYNRSLSESYKVGDERTVIIES